MMISHWLEDGILNAAGETTCLSPEDRNYANAVSTLTNVEKCNKLYDKEYKL
jgi:hypothetical protein